MEARKNLGLDPFQGPIDNFGFLRDSYRKQAGAELCQAQVKLQVVVEFGVKVGVRH